jgi:AraC family transcriptional regulator
MQIDPLRSEAGDPLLHVTTFRTAGGPVELAAHPAHRLKLHAGTPVAGRCGHERFRYTRGDLDSIPPGMEDRWHEDEASNSLIVELSSWLIGRAADELCTHPGQLALPPRHQFRDPQIEHVVWALHGAHTEGSPASRLYVESLGLALAARLLAGHSGPATSMRGLAVATSMRGLAPATQRRVLAYIDEHIDRDLSLFALAEVAGMSASHLKAQFKRSQGLSVHAYVMRRRVERARRLLADGASISRVALDAGFSHPSHMARWMKRLLGATPRAFQRELA